MLLVSCPVNAGELASALVRSELIAPHASTNSTSFTTRGEIVAVALITRLRPGALIDVVSTPG